MLPVPAPLRRLPCRRARAPERLTVLRPAGESLSEGLDIAGRVDEGARPQVSGKRPLAGRVREGDGKSAEHVGEGLVGQAQVAVSYVALLERQADVVAGAEIHH